MQMMEKKQIIDKIKRESRDLNNALQDLLNFPAFECNREAVKSNNTSIIAIAKQIVFLNSIASEIEDL